MTKRSTGRALRRNTEMLIFFHARHICDHAVYWSHPGLAMMNSAFPCSWCDGASDIAIPREEIIGSFDSPNNERKGYVVREKLPDGSFPMTIGLSRSGRWTAYRPQRMLRRPSLGTNEGRVRAQIRNNSLMESTS